MVPVESGKDQLRVAKPSYETVAHGEIGRLDLIEQLAAVRQSTMSLSRALSLTQPLITARCPFTLWE